MKFCKTQLSWLPFCINLLLLSCEPTTEQKIQKKLSKLIDQEIVIDSESMLRFGAQPDSKPFAQDGSYKIVVLISEEDCLGCFLEHISLWEVLEKEFSVLGLPVEMKYIFQIESSKVDEITKQIRLSPLMNESLADTMRVFERDNTFLPKEELFHTFLLDKNNRIRVVGNPVENDEVKGLFINLISSGTDSNAQEYNGMMK